MENTSVVSILVLVVSRLKAFAFAVLILAGLLLASGQGRVNAASEKSTDDPNCGGQPICGYLRTHYADRAGAANISIPAFLADQPRPGADDMQLTVEKSTLVRSGPGENFYSYGELPAWFESRLIGVDQLGDWWVIPLSFTTAPDGLGWVDAASVKVSNVAITQIDPLACEGVDYCDYLQAHSPRVMVSGEIACSGQSICGDLQAHNRQYLPVLAPSYAAERLFGQPGIAVTGLCKPTTTSDC